MLWLALALALWPFHGRLQRELRATNPVRGSESALADAQLRDAFDSPARAVAILVISGLPMRADSDDGRATVRRLVASVRTTQGVGVVISPGTSLDTMLLGSNGTTALALVGLTDDDPAVLASLRAITARLVVAERTTLPTLRMQWTGQPAVLADLRTSSATAARNAELRALPIMLLVAWWAFGSFTGAVAAIVIAALVTSVGVGMMGMLAATFAPSVMARSIVSLVGLALTVDYLLLLSRARTDPASQQRARKTVVLAAVIVAAGFAGLILAPTGELRTTAVTGALVALIAAGAVITVGGAHSRYASHVTHEVATSALKRNDWWLRWGTLVTRNPTGMVIVSAVPLLLLASHARTAKLSTPLDNWLPYTSESTQALRTLEGNERASIAGSARVLLTLPLGMNVLSAQGWAAITRVGEAIRALPVTSSLRSVATIGTGELVVAQHVFSDEVRRHYISRDGRVAVLDVVPREGQGTANAIALVSALRTLDAEAASGVPHADMTVTGLAAYSIDYQRATRAALPWVVFATSLATLIALLVAFRAPLVAVKAVVLNLLVAAATLGATVVVFQDGVGASWLGREATGSILPTVPLLAFAATFGISMDYELFLLNGVRGARRAGRTERDAIALGLSHTAGLITRAGGVMIGVFSAFMMSELLPLAMVGFALTTAVLLDVTLVRLVLAPALLSLGGRWNWWPRVAWDEPDGAFGDEHVR